MKFKCPIRIDWNRLILNEPTTYAGRDATANSR